MLRIAVPYGLLSSTQVRKLAHISRKYDKGYVHFTTRQNIQLNWPVLEEVPDILAELASVEMHAIQTSGNCIRNTTTDQFAGVAKMKLKTPAPGVKLFASGLLCTQNLPFCRVNLRLLCAALKRTERHFCSMILACSWSKTMQGETGFQVYVGGGLGRTPVIASSIREFLPKQHLLTYLDAVLRVYNRYGNRDNKYKARIKILVRAWTPEVFAERVEAEWAQIQPGKDGPATLTAVKLSGSKDSLPCPTTLLSTNQCCGQPHCRLKPPTIAPFLAGWTAMSGLRSSRATPRSVCP